MKSRLALVCAATLLLCRCSGGPQSPSPPGLGAVEPPPVVGGGGGIATLVGAGDIADCGLNGSALTASLLDRIGGTVFTTGDNVYPVGTAEQFRNCYGPTWGRHRDRTRPTPGNHDYHEPGAAAYFEYFGSNAGTPGLGYYSYPAGGWHVVALNSEVPAHPGSPQHHWLRADLTAHRTRCTAAYWHKPVFSSGPHGDDPHMLEIWRTLYEFDVDVVIVGHDHMYERFAPLDRTGGHDSVRGIRQFTVGTGGARPVQPRTVRQNSEAIGNGWGVLALTLLGDSYQWEFIPTDGTTFRDAGSASCH
jgi:hypothetical protein